MLGTIDYADAKKVIDALAGEIAKAGGAGVIAVADPFGELIAFARMDGAPVSSIRIAMNKAWTAARERKSTEEIGKKARDPEKGFEIAYFGDERFVGWGGGVPVWRDGHVIGAVAVSGLPQAEDIRLATWAAGLLGS
ncbi:MAG TPA: heme-binding protein [Bryobacteraceae bacterium]|nr:heme-binding protein [Bryobacteraceae bacterium]